MMRLSVNLTVRTLRPEPRSIGFFFFQGLSREFTCPVLGDVDYVQVGKSWQLLGKLGVS